MTGFTTQGEKLFSEIEKIFEILKDLFDGELPTPTFTLRLEKKVVFRLSPGGGIIFVGSKFPTIGFTEMLVLLLHEMVHMQNQHKGISDCTSNQYHNKQFMEAALDVGLYVGRHKTRGWGLTSFSERPGAMAPTPEKLEARRETVRYLTKKYNDGDNRRGLEFSRKQVRGLIRNAKPRRKCFLKYVCGCPLPYNNIRSGRRPDGKHPLNIHCDDCGQVFRCVEDF